MDSQDMTTQDRTLPQVEKEVADRQLLGALALLDNEAWEFLALATLRSMAARAGGFRDKEGIRRLQKALDAVARSRGVHPAFEEEEEDLA